MTRFARLRETVVIRGRQTQRQLRAIAQWTLNRLGQIRRRVKRVGSQVGVLWDTAVHWIQAGPSRLRQQLTLLGPQALRRSRVRVLSLAIMGWLVVALWSLNLLELPRALHGPAIVLLAVVLTLPSVILTVWIRARGRSGWIGTVSRREMRRILGLTRSKGARGWFLDQIRLLASPSKTALAVGSVVTVIAIAGLFLISLKAAATTPTEAYLALWQVQTALGGIALPILVFVIELAKDDETLARSTAEVLIRYTWIFPVISFVLLSSLVFGVGGYWFVSRAAYPLLFALHVATIVFAVFAYWRVLQLLFNKERLKDESARLLLERFERSIDETVERRLGANLLLQKAEQLGLKYSPFEPNPKDDRYLVLRSPTAGLVDDVNLWHLEEFVRQLPWTQPAAVPLVSGEAPATSSGATQSSFGGQAPPRVQLLKVYGGRVYEADRGLLALTVSDFEPLDRGALEQRLQEVFRIVRPK